MPSIQLPQDDIHRWDDALVAFAERLRGGADTAALIHAGIETLAAELQADRVGFGTLSADALSFTVADDWSRPGPDALPSITGTHRIDEHAYMAGLLRQGRGVVVADVRLHPEFTAIAGVMEAAGIRAQLVLPAMDGSRLTGAFFIHDRQPRDWACAEVSFARDAVERVRHAIERRRSEQSLQALARTLEQQVAERTRALRESEDFIRLALSASGGVGVWTYDILADRIVCDAAIAALYGIDVAEGARGVSGAAFFAHVHPDDLPRLQAALPGGVAGDADLELEYRIRHPDGQLRWVLSRGHTYVGAAQRPERCTGVSVETTARRQLEEQLRQAQKMESLGQLTGGIAHDFNNLLQGIVLPLQILQKRLGPAAEAGLQNYLDAAMAAAKRAAGLTQRLLAFARRQPLDSRTADLGSALADLEPMLRNICGPRIALALDLPAALWPVVTDVNQFENAVLNLAINARDAMPSGGTLTVSARNVAPETRPRGALAGLRPGEYVCVAVGDTGSGMAPDVIERAFDPFFTTKPIGQGTGLGLSMVYGYTRQSGGMAAIDSALGQGSRVAMFFPRAPVARAADGLQAPAAPPRDPFRRRVLVVEDEEAVRRFAVELLREEGCEIREASTGHEAMTLLETERDFDLLLTDVGLPGPNGRQVADLARENIPGIAVILMTGYAEGAAHKNTFLGAGMQLILKPFDSAVLVERVRRALALPQPA
ncbi:response regulator [Xylophilus rhododendri]|uniref:histidine kinase n=1 Tax=Xylophilus rhododendri TaxID=2697032 RepID=A0A857J503_9BURK|nr:response regulator [Xylophilus rhododendri]QHI98112.1 response regulator [Xylophilus rhododendri]